MISLWSLPLRYFNEKTCTKSSLPSGQHVPLIPSSGTWLFWWNLAGLKFHKASLYGKFSRFLLFIKKINLNVPIGTLVKTFLDYDIPFLREPSFTHRNTKHRSTFMNILLIAVVHSKREETGSGKMVAKFINLLKIYKWISFLIITIIHRDLNFETYSKYLLVVLVLNYH
jgi:hypothetical protein